MTAPNKSAILLFAHGSSDPNWARPFEAIRERVAGGVSCPVALAYLERMTPSLADAVGELKAQGVEHLVLIPLFLAVGGHMRNDLPSMVSEASAAHAVTIEVKPTIGESEPMLRAIVDWITAQAPL